MAKPLINSLFKIASVLTASADVTHNGHKDYHDGWVIGRRDLAWELIALLKDNLFNNLAIIVLKLIRVVSSESEALPETYGRGWGDGRKDLARQVIRELGVDHEVCATIPGEVED